MNVDPTWPLSLRAESAIDGLAESLYQARCWFHGTEPKEWPMNVPYNQRMLYHEVALRCAQKMGAPSKSDDLQLRDFANAIARSLMVVR